MCAAATAATATAAAAGTTDTATAPTTTIATQLYALHVTSWLVHTNNTSFGIVTDKNTSNWTYMMLRNPLRMVVMPRNL
jgi:hypothetical protein